MAGVPADVKRSPDGYDICPACGHNTCQAVAGICTVMRPEYFFTFSGSPYCNCDCYKAIHGISLTEEILQLAWLDLKAWLDEKTDYIVIPVKMMKERMNENEDVFHL
jgi:hypothetical protein